MSKHFPSDGASEAGREAHNHFGKFNVYPMNLPGIPPEMAARANAGLDPTPTEAQMNAIYRKAAERCLKISFYAGLFEDVPFDMECHKDTEGHVYDYGYGLDWNRQISDWRTKKYCTK